jgi:aryl-phospho-beta-D-glucosidase BglC (GH1 family)
VHLSIVQSLGAVLYRCRSAVTAVLVFAVALNAAVGSARPVRAATPPAGLPLPRVLAIPAQAFPRGAAVRSARASNEQAATATGLHTLSLAQLGRVEGYAQTAQWGLSPQQGHVYTATLQYEASIFVSPGEAADATTDARASLWETGIPIRVTGIGVPVFSLRDRGGFISIAVESVSGTIESELVLRFSARVSGAVQQSALRQLARLWTAANALAVRLALPNPGAPATVQPTPNVFLAPAGTGPVIKSPSLMVLDPSLLSDDSTQLDGGVFRSSSPPAIAAQSRPSMAVVPLGPVSRYVELAQVGTRDDLYDSASLFLDAADARDAYDNLVRSNTALRLSAIPLGAGTPGLQRLTSADAARAWQLGNKTVMVILWQNVVIVLEQRGPDSGSLPSMADLLLSTVPSWLHAAGTQTVDATNSPVHLTGLNWYGAEQQDFVVGGLDYEPYQSILWTIKRAGYNTIRLPFSDQLVEQNPIITAHVGANPELAGLHAMDVFDRIISYAGAIGISVILDNHRSDAGWSSQENGLWYTPTYPESAFDRDWSTMAQRYASSNVVVGADLRNEPHGVARWANGDPATDWKMAAERAGNTVLASNPHLLIVVEGVQYYGTAPSYWWGGNLMGVATAPVLLQFANGASAHSQLVYSTHDYGVDNCNTGCPWFNTTTSYASLAAIWDQYWGYITADASRPYAAPVWVGEFGTCNYNVGCVSDSIPGSQGQWFQSLIQYIGSKHLGWAYWSANATQSTGGTRTYGTLDWYGFFQPNWTAPVPWLTEALRTIQTDTRTSGLPSGHAD